MGKISSFQQRNEGDMPRANNAVVRLGIYGDVNLADVDDVTAGAGVPAKRKSAVHLDKAA